MALSDNQKLLLHSTRDDLQTASNDCNLALSTGESAQFFIKEAVNKTSYCLKKLRAALEDKDFCE